MKGRLQRTAADMNAKNVTLSHYVKEHYDFEIKPPAYEQDQSVNRNKKPCLESKHCTGRRNIQMKLRQS